MNTLLVCYDLHSNNPYEAFYNTIESYDHCWAMDNHCLVRTRESAGQVRERLHSSIGSHDAIIVCRFSGDWAGISDEAESWLNERNVIKDH